MRKIWMFIIIGILSIFLLGCTDAAWDSMVGKLNVPAEILCYSGAKEIYRGRSTGAPQSAEGSDGYQFREEDTNNFLEVSGNCVLRYLD